MSHLQYTSYEGFGERMKKDFHYSQAVRIGDTIECSGQGGWNRTTEEIPTDLGAEIDQAFDNVDHALKVAGGKGWEQVYKVRCYLLPMSEEGMQHMLRNFRKWMPGHQPLYTVVGVEGLGLEKMRVEVEVKAHLGG